MEVVLLVQQLAIVGSTGSIGQQTLEVVSRFPERFRVCVLVASSNIDLMEKQIRQFSPQLAVLTEPSAAAILEQRLDGLSTMVLGGQEGLLEAVTHPDVNTVMMAISGMVGLVPTLAAIKASKKIALANKETLVAGGDVIMAAARANGVQILPVDSEHSAIWQCLHSSTSEVEKLILTASGGPFRGWTKEELERVTPAMALRHPKWNMGPKITVDSATLMNKGLEVIEAHWLFNMPYERIEVVVHPQSIVHSAVLFQDGAMLAQLGAPDMRVPIQYALSWPDRWPSPVDRPDLAQLGQLTFEKPDLGVFPCLALAYHAGRMGGTMPLVLNTANEEAVKLFLAGQVPFTAIPRLVEMAMERYGRETAEDEISIEEILLVERETREWLQRDGSALLA